jgi:hypothetical protein
MNRVLNKESLSGIIGAILAIYLLVNLDTLVETGATTCFSSQSLPRVLLWIILGCSAVLLVQGMIGNKQTEIVIDMNVIRKGLGFALYCGAFFVYLVLLPFLGFMISTCLLSCVILVNYRQRKATTYILIFAIVVIINFLFKNFMYINLPVGSLLGGY